MVFIWTPFLRLRMSRFYRYSRLQFIPIGFGRQAAERVGDGRAVRAAAGPTVLAAAGLFAYTFVHRASWATGLQQLRSGKVIDLTACWKGRM